MKRMVLVVLVIFGLCGSAWAGLGEVLDYQKISYTEGSFTGALSDGDNFGRGIASLGDLDGDGVTDIAVGAWEDDDGGTGRGAVWILFLDYDGTVKSHQKISDTQGGFTGILEDKDRFGFSIISIGDLDGDGVTDMAVGAFGDDDGGGAGADRGAVWIIFLNYDGTVKGYQLISDTQGGFTGDLGDDDTFGGMVASLGDLDGDGVVDIAVGAGGDDDGGTNRGAVWILFLNIDGTVKSYQKISDTQGGFAGTISDNDRFDIVAAIDDLDGDGVDDIAVGAYQDDDGGTNKGAVWILFLNSDGTVKGEQKISDTEGEFTGGLDDGDRFGVAITKVGDLDYDGIDEIAVAADLDNDGGTNRGAVWILSLNTDGTVKWYQKISDTEGGFAGVLDDDGSLGKNLAGLGDLDGDGRADLAVGAVGDDDGGTDRGAVWILFLDGLSEPNLVAHWELEEGGGGTAYDSAGGNDGTLVGDTDWVDGKIGTYALDFDGSGDYVEVPDDDSLNPSDEITIAFWIYERTDQQGGVFKWASCPWESGSPGDSRGYFLSTSQSQRRVAFNVNATSQTGDTIFGITEIGLNEWHHIAATFDRGQATVYVDGDLDNSETMSVSSIMNDAQPLLFGRVYSYCSGTTYVDRLDGMIDDVRIYDRALDAGEVLALYEGSLPEGITYHVDGLNGNDSNDGLSREEAFATIQMGIDTAIDGDTVLVWPGLYNESIYFIDKPITVKSAADAAVIEASGLYAASFYTTEGQDSVLKNFVISNSDTGILVTDSRPTISNITLANNNLGIDAESGAIPQIYDCIFYNNGTDVWRCSADYSMTSGAGDVNTPVAHLTFDEEKGVIAHDMAGDNDGVIHGAVRTTGRADGGLYFDGVDDYVELPDNEPVWLPVNNFTLACWVYFERDIGIEQDSILHLNFGESSTSSNELGYKMSRVKPDGRLIFQMTTTTNPDEDLYSTNALVKGKWYHLVAVRAGTTQAIYIDGSLNTSRTCSTDPIDFVGGYDDDKVNIGVVTNTAGPPRYFLQGKIDDVRIYGTALSKTEIEAIYQAGMGGIVYSDPMFADANGEDYHLRSERGRYWPAYDVWVLDDVTSPGVDMGIPFVDPSNERMPNGGQVNIGAYGDSAYASMSEWPLWQDNNRDGHVDYADFASFAEAWLEQFDWVQ